MSTRTVLVIGADGVLGSTVAAIFACAGWQVLRGTRRPPRAPDAVLVDLDRPATIGPAMLAADITVNTVADADLTAERWALDNGALVVNVATVPVNSARKLRIHAAQSPPIGAVLLNAGLAPGVTNLAIADMLARHPEADTVEFVMCLPASGMSGPSGVHFVHENLTTIGRHGVYNKRSPHHDVRTVELPHPVGRKKCFGFGERERAWLLDTSGGRNVHTYAYLDRPVLHRMIVALNPFGLLADVPKSPFLFGRSQAPAVPTDELIMHWAAVSLRGRRLDARTVECAGGYLHAAAASEIFASSFLDMASTRLLRGSFNPDEVFTLEQMRHAFAGTGIDVVDRGTAPAAATVR